MNTDPNDTVIAQEINCEIKQFIGPDATLGTLVHEATLKACEALLNTAADEFFVDAAPDLKALLRLTREQAQRTESASLDADILVHVYNIKSHAKILGFTLITDICMHIVKSAHSKKLDLTKKLLVVGHLIDALALTFERRIRDDGGSFGRELRERISGAV